jgi:thymidylate kinase
MAADVSESTTAWHSNREMVLLRLIAVLDRSGIPYCLVGDTRRFPKEIRSDVDIVVHQAALPEITKLLFRFCADQKLHLVQVLQHEQTAWYFAIAWFDQEDNLCFLNPDFCADFFHLGRLFLLADELLGQRRPALDATGKERGFYIISPAHEFIYYLLKKIDKQDFEPPHGDYLSHQWRKDPEGALAQLRRFWSEPKAQILTKAAATNSWNEVMASLPSLQSSLHASIPFSLSASWLELKRKIQRVCQPTGVMVAILGPDGSGKSAVITRLMESLLPAFRRTERVHLRPKFGMKVDDNGAPIVDPHGQSARGWFVSILKLAYWLFDYVVGYALGIRPQLVRSTLVLFDRYYHDLLVDPRRYRFGGPTWLARLLGKFVPQPNLWIFLDAPAETLQKRKREVPLAESLRQREAYRQQIRSFSNHVIVDASQPLEKVVNDASRSILNFMARRMKKRCERHCPLGDRL